MRFSESNPTIKILCLHYFLPFILAALVRMHSMLHAHVSFNPVRISGNVEYQCIYNNLILNIIIIYILKNNIIIIQINILYKSIIGSNRN